MEQAPHPPGACINRKGMGEMTTYDLTAWAKDAGWRDIRVLNAGGMHEAIELAEAVTGCRVSHGVGKEQTEFQPGTIIDAESGDVQQVHDRKAKPQVVAGPPDVLRAIAQAIKGSPKPAARRNATRTGEAPS